MLNIYPSPKKQAARQVRLEKLKKRKWRIEYDLNYDGGSEKWTGYYNTVFFARIAAFFNVRIDSWGGTADLYLNHFELNKKFKGE